MKAKNILMTLLLAVGAIAAKASGFPPELALVSQPVMVYNHSSITVYYDVENIGDYTYKGYVSVYLDPDYGYSYDEEYVKVRPGHIKRIALEIPLRRIDRRRTFTIMPYYELGDELYSFTTFEYFDPIRFYWDGPRTERWVVITVPPCIRYYHRPGSYRYYYDGFRPPMPPAGHEPRPMDPMHHTYGYHYSIGGYPASHPEWSNNNEMPKPNNNVAPSATVRPNSNAGSMSSASNSGGNNTPAPNSGSSSGSVSRPSGSNSGTSRPSGSSSSVSRPSSTNTNSSVRPSSTSTSRPSSGNSSSSVSRPSSTSSSSSARPSSTSSSNRSSSSSSSVGRTSSSTSSTRSSATSSSTSSTSRSSSTTSGSRSGSSAGRR